MTKIIATINKNPYDSKMTEKIIKAGASVLRFNLAHNDPKINRKYMEDARRLCKKHGNCKIMADIPGSKIRIAPYYKKNSKKESNFKVIEGKNYIIKSGSCNRGGKLIIINFPEIDKLINIDDTLIAGDGETAFKIANKKKNGDIIAKCLKSCEVPYRTAIYSNNIGAICGEISGEIDNILEEMQKFEPDYITRSFVSNAGQIIEYKRILAKYNLQKIPLFAKIETQEGVDNIDKIAKNVDGVMVARGDLGLCADYRRIGINQKKICESAKKYKKICIVSTQIIESLNTKFVPERSDILDLTNIVFDGADMIMLCRETARTEHPEKNVKIVSEIISLVEKYKKRSHLK